jgi:hypothetical protein
MNQAATSVASSEAASVDQELPSGPDMATLQALAGALGSIAVADTIEFLKSPAIDDTTKGWFIEALLIQRSRNPQTLFYIEMFLEQAFTGQLRLRTTIILNLARIAKERLLGPKVANLADEFIKTN